MRRHAPCKAPLTTPPTRATPPPHLPVLPRGRHRVDGQSQVGRPRRVPDPVGVPLERRLERPAGVAAAPDLCGVVAAGADEALDGRLRLLRRAQAAGRRGGRPRHGGAAERVGVGDLLRGEKGPSGVRQLRAAPHEARMCQGAAARRRSCLAQPRSRPAGAWPLRPSPLRSPLLALPAPRSALRAARSPRPAASSAPRRAPTSFATCRLAGAPRCLCCRLTRRSQTSDPAPAAPTRRRLSTRCAASSASCTPARGAGGGWAGRAREGAGDCVGRCRRSTGAQLQQCTRAAAAEPRELGAPRAAPHRAPRRSGSAEPCMLKRFICAHLHPLAVRALLPNDDTVVEASRGQQRSVARVRPRDLPHGSLVASQVRDLRPVIPGQLEHLDRPVRAAGRQSPPVVVKLDVMDHIYMPRLEGRRRGHLCWM